MSIRYVLQSARVENLETGASGGDLTIIHCGDFHGRDGAILTLAQDLRELDATDPRAVAVFRKVIHSGQYGIFRAGNHVLTFQRVYRPVRDVMYNPKTHVRTVYNFPPRTAIGG